MQTRKAAPGIGRLRTRCAVAALVTVALSLSVTPAALADHGHRAFPSQGQVDAAKSRAQQKARDVGAIKASLVLAKQRLDAADTRAEQASEAYNGAMWRLQEAKQKLQQAQADAERARRNVSKQRDAIAALVAQSYQQGSQLTALNAMMSASGPEGVLDQYAAFQGASTSMQADYQRFAASDALAKVFEKKAEQAKADKVALAAQAKTARDAAASAAQQAQAAAGQIAAQEQLLIKQLARAQNISVTMAKQRQTALEAIARKRAEERARREARARARAEARPRAEAAAAAARAAKRAAKAAQAQGNPTPPPPPPPPPSSGGTGGAAQAIAFAKAQLGEPYLWGGAGPSSWDCSGLTSGAWGSAGVYLPHYAAAQYDAGTPIPISSARPGDLLFWSSNGAPSGIHHVALYLGGGRFIEAPHTGANVRYNSIYFWYPDFAVRL
jgi:cell wall-associated NlpC family hydrolase